MPKYSTLLREPFPLARIIQTGSTSDPFSRSSHKPVKPPTFRLGRNEQKKACRFRPTLILNPTNFQTTSLCLKNQDREVRRLSKETTSNRPQTAAKVAMDLQIVNCQQVWSSTSHPHLPLSMWARTELNQWRVTKVTQGPQSPFQVSISRKRARQWPGFPSGQPSNKGGGLLNKKMLSTPIAPRTSWVKLEERGPLWRVNLDPAGLRDSGHLWAD